MAACIFSFYISEHDVPIQELSNRFVFGKYIVQTDSRTPCSSASHGERGCAIFGLAVNVLTGQSANLVETILSCCSGISDVIALEKQLGGKYLIFYRDQSQYYILGDATCSIPVFYNTEKAFSCSSNCQYLVNQYGYVPDEALQQIRSSGEISQAMPYDLTQYREVKQLLPNHCLSVNQAAAVRFVNAGCPQPILTAQNAAEMTAPMIAALSNFYKSRFPIYCPITSGRDSRVVLAFLTGGGVPAQCYTIRHPQHRDDTQDLVIPKQLCQKNGLPYTQLRDVTVSEDLKSEMDRLLGEGQYSLNTLRIAQTVREHFGDGAIINGDIIGQVGKCSLHRDIPLCFATPGYFRCKLHNYSSGAKDALKRWLDEAAASEECVNVFDLFSIENRMGRWAAQENLIYNSIGQVYLNIFNSRSIIYTWTAVSRAERKRCRIHSRLIEGRMPSLLTVPFETDESAVIRLAKANGFTYLLSSYAKYYIERTHFKRGKTDEETDHYSR